MNRRELLVGALGLEAASCGAGNQSDIPQSAISPRGVGRGIRHVSHSDVGGRPDCIQVMVNRGHIYVGNMFSDGVTILNAEGPSALRPVGFFAAGGNTHTLRRVAIYMFDRMA